MRPENPIVELVDVTKRYGGVVALDDINVAIAPGEHVALVGDNGAGKSTLAKIFSGAVRPEGGDVLVDGATVSMRSPAAARSLGIETVYQDLALVDHMDVVSNIFLGREAMALHLGPLSILAKRAMRERAREVLARTGVTIGDLNAKSWQLSGGQRQGVAIARAVGWGSRLIVLDEPTAALGVQESQKVEATISGLKGAGIAVLMISHNLRQVFDLVDTIWVLRRGRLVGSHRKEDVDINDVVTMITTGGRPAK